MQFSNTTNSFYPSDKTLLEKYSDIPEDLIEISEEDYLRFLNNEYGNNIQLSDGKLQARCSDIGTTTFIDYKTRAREIRNLLRDKIDKFLLPSSTINDTLVTEEQKQILIQDSLLLAKWPSIESWPYIPLPTLSDLCKSIITIQVWRYPEQINTTEE